MFKVILRIHIHIHISSCSKIELCFHGIPRFSVNYNDVWKEVDSAEFMNMAPSNRYDRDSVRRLADLIREDLQILQNPAHLSLAQINDMKTKV